MSWHPTHVDCEGSAYRLPGRYAGSRVPPPKPWAALLLSLTLNVLGGRFVGAIRKPS